MKVMWKAVCAAALLIAATTIEIGCGNTYRPVATPLPVTTGNPSGAETEVVLNQNPNGGSSVLTTIDVSGDTNAGNKLLNNVVGSAVEGSVLGSLGTPVNVTATPLAFDFSRTSVFTANTSTDSVTQATLSTTTAGFAAGTTTISLEPGSAPVGMSFQYFGATYTQDYVVNSGTTTATCPGTGSITAIAQPSAAVLATICLGTATTPANPLSAWIYKDQSKVFVLDSKGNVYVVSASKYKVTNTIPVGGTPIKVAQSATGQYIYVLNTNGSITIIDGQAEAVVGTPVSTAISTASLTTAALPIDIAQDPNYTDTIANSQYNHIWVLLADGTVNVYDGTTPGQLTWITSLSTITPAQLTAGVYPTNLALMRDGTGAYVGLGNTSQIVGINTSQLATGGAITMNAATAITLDVLAGGISRRNVTQTLTDTAGNPHTVTVETTVPTVNSIAVSRGGNSADLSKVYAATTTSTTYYCYDSNVNPTDCANADPWDGTSSFIVSGCTDLAGQNAMSCPNLYNGAAVVTAANNGTTPINTFVTTILSPWVGTYAGPVVSYCNAGNPAAGQYDGQKNCPAMVPVLVLGRS